MAPEKLKMFIAIGILFAGSLFVYDIYSNHSLKLNEALAIAKSSSCVDVGNLTEDNFYNENTRTWWIDLDAEKEGCAPACVVDEKTQTAEVNWRCTGLISE